MKHRLYIFLFFCCLVGLESCKKISIPEEEDDKTESTANNYNQNAPVVDCDDTQNTGDEVPNPGTGPYRGYNSLTDYLTFYGSLAHPIPLEDLLPGGCVYQEIMKDAKYSGVNHCYIEGYIVGFINGTSISKTIFSSDQAVETNIVLAASPDEKNPLRCVPVQLANGSADQKTMRQALNLASHPEMLGQYVCLAGHLRYYMRTLGLQSVYDGYLEGEQPQDPDTPEEPETPDNPDTPDEPDNPSDDSDTPTGPYHGYPSITTYLTAFSQSYDTPAPFEDFLEGGCVYEDIVIKKKDGKKWAAKSVWVRGFIVGVASSENGELEGIFEGNWTGLNGYQHDTNILLAPTADTKDIRQCIPVELPNKTEVRKKLNLYNNPGNQGREVAVKGTISYYFGTSGIKNTSDYHFFE